MALAVVAVVFVAGCQDTKKVTEMQGQIDTANQKITELETQLAKVTVEKDSLGKLVVDLAAKVPAAKTGGGKTGGTKTGGTGGGTLKPPTKK